MDADRRDEALTGAALDRELREALAVDPSPEFVARVRTRIASEPARATSWLSWKFVAVGAMAALIAIAIVVSRDERSRRSRDSASQPDVAQAFRPADSGAEPLARGTQAPPLHPGPLVSGFPSADLGAGSWTTARSAKAFARRPREPEVLLDPAETRALRRLIAGTRHGTLDLSASLQATTPAVMDLPPLSEIAIPFITIDPITPESGEEGARQ